PRLARTVENAATSVILPKPLEMKIQLMMTRPTRATTSWQFAAQRSAKEVSAGVVETDIACPPVQSWCPLLLHCFAPTVKRAAYWRAAHGRAAGVVPRPGSRQNRR